MTVVTDSIVAYEGLSDSCSRTGFNGGLLETCKELMSRNWKVVLKHTFREGNMVAGWIRNWAMRLSLGTHILDLPPIGLDSLHQVDSRGVSFPHVVH